MLLISSMNSNCRCSSKVSLALLLGIDKSMIGVSLMEPSMQLIRNLKEFKKRKSSLLVRKKSKKLFAKGSDRAWDFLIRKLLVLLVRS